MLFSKRTNMPQIFSRPFYRLLQTPVAKPLIWREADEDLVVIETSIYSSLA